MGKKFQNVNPPPTFQKPPAPPSPPPLTAPEMILGLPIVRIDGCPSCSAKDARIALMEAELTRLRKEVERLEKCGYRLGDELLAADAELTRLRDMNSALNRSYLLDRIVLLENEVKRHAAIAERVRHCTECGGDWYDGGLNSRCYCVDVKQAIGAHEESVRQLEAVENRLAAKDARIALMEKVVEAARELRESLRRCDRDGVPMINASALLAFDTNLRALDAQVK